jgi:hypothetical protein
VPHFSRFLREVGFLTLVLLAATRSLGVVKVPANGEKMTGSLSYLLDAGWLFFAGWSLVVVAVSVIAFGKDFVSVPPLFEKRVFEKPRTTDLGKVHANRMSS